MKRAQRHMKIILMVLPKKLSFEAVGPFMVPQ